MKNTAFKLNVPKFTDGAATACPGIVRHLATGTATLYIQVTE